MPVPWLNLVDVAVDLTNLALSKRRPRTPPEPESLTPGGGTLGQLETHLARVVVAALKEAFDRDSTRIELEREQMELERQRAERALRLEQLRQAGEREIGRLRFLAGVAVASLVAALVVSLRSTGVVVGVRVLLGAAWLLLVAALAVSFAAQAGIGRRLARIEDAAAPSEDVVAGSVVAPWLIVAGLAAVGAAMLVG